MEIIKFNKNIYNLKVIEEAIKEYKNLANFKVKMVGNYLEVSIDKIDQDVQAVIKNEFANYVLGLMS
ncbi:MAG: HxsD-like protein [Candidatus Parcubacteria bacterium]|nr:HxsD-like protein [Candidatus Parcubacteria bacterium]